MADPVPADDAGAELAVARPHLPSADLADLLDGSVAPLSAVYGLDDQRFRAFAIEVARVTRVSEAGRLIVGAYLHKRRAEFARGEWTPWVAELAEALNVKTDTLGRWVLAAERHFGMELTKGANPTRRRPVTRTDPSTEIVAGGATNPPAGRRRRATAPAAAPGGDDSPGAGVTLAQRPTSRVASPAGPSAQRGAPQSSPAGTELDAPQEVCPRCHGSGTVPAAGRGNAARVDAAAAVRQRCAHPKRRALGYLTLCADCGENLSGR